MFDCLPACPFPLSNIACALCTQQHENKTRGASITPASSDSLARIRIAARTSPIIVIFQFTLPTTRHFAFTLRSSLAALSTAPPMIR
jgi:hypothetical protein